MEEIILLLQQIKEQLEVRNKLTLSVDEAPRCWACPGQLSWS